MVELRIEREKRIAKWYFIQGICIEKRGKIWVADVLLKEVRNQSFSCELYEGSLPCTRGGYSGRKAVLGGSW